MTKRKYATKKTAAPKKSLAAKQPKEGSDEEVFRLNVVDFKYIGGAIQQTIDNLKKVRTFARDRALVDDKVQELEKMRVRVNELCPQDWFDPYTLITDAAPEETK